MNTATPRIIPASGNPRHTTDSKPWPPDLAPHLLAVLEAEGLSTPALWIAAGRRRFQVFGIPRKTVARLDAIARTLRP